MGLPVFELPLDDAGEGAVALGLLRGAGTATFSRGSAASCRMWKPHYTQTGHLAVQHHDFTQATLQALIGSGVITYTRAGNATRVNPHGLIETVGANEPRFDYHPVTKVCLGLLVEVTRTNLIAWTDYMAGQAAGYYSFSNTTLSDSGIASPVAGQNWTKFEATTTSISNAPKTVSGAGSASGVVYSVYIKKGSGATQANKYFLHNSSTGQTVMGGFFNFDTGAWTTTSGSGTARVARITADTYRLTLASTNNVAAGNNIAFYTAFTGSLETQGVYSYATAPQLEQGLEPTSLILTAGAQVTRNSDDVVLSSIAGFYNPFEGTISMEINRRAGPGTAASTDRFLGMFQTGNSSAERIVLLVDQNDFFFQIIDNNITQTSLQGGTPDGINRVAFSYKANSAVFAQDGVLQGTDSGLTLPVVDTISLGRESGIYLNGHLRSFTYIPQAVPQADVITLSAGVSFSKGSLLKKVASGVARSHYMRDGRYAGYYTETAKINSVISSEVFGGVSWPKTRSSGLDNSGVAPDGTITADFFSEDGTASSEHYMQQSVAISDGTTAAFSLFVKPGTRTQIALNCVQRDAATVRGAFFDVSTGQVIGNDVGVTAEMEPWGNGWWRCMMVTSVGTGGTNPAMRIQLLSSGQEVYSGDNSSGLYIWGAQAEVGDYASSYITTVGSTVTRNSDFLVYNFAPPAVSGSICCELSVDVINANAHRAVSLNNNSSDEIYLGGVSTSRLLVFDNGVQQANITGGAFTARTPFREAARYAANNFAISVNGGTVTVQNSGTMPTVTQVAIGCLNGVSGSHDGTVRDVRIYDEAVNDTSLRDLAVGGLGNVGVQGTVGPI